MTDATDLPPAANVSLAADPLPQPTPEQRLIIEAPDGPIVVLAGAGTGKTRVIVERVRWLLETKSETRVRGEGTGARAESIPAEPAPGHDNPFAGPLVPEQLLVLTYNVKAAAELAERLDQTPGIGPAVRARMTVKNFHGFCHRVLVEQAAEAELPVAPDVLDGPGQLLLLRDLRPGLDLLYHNDYGLAGLVDFINRAKDELVSPDDFDAFVAHERAAFEAAYGSYQAALDRLRAAGNLAPLREVAGDYRRVRSGERLEGLGRVARAYDPEAPARAADRAARRAVRGDGSAPNIRHFSEPDQARVHELAAGYEQDGAALEILRQHELAAVYRAYQAALAERGALDFGEQIALVIRLFQAKPNVLRRWQRQYRYILVDEFQDANAAQIELIELLGRTPDRPDNVMVVGDDDQSIYRFRGATVDAFGDFRDRFSRAPAHDPRAVPSGPPPVWHVTQNFRSGRHVLDGANSLITRNLARLDPGKRLRTEKPVGQPVELIVCNGAEDEAVAIVDRIRELAGPQPGGAPGARPRWNSVAVLYRKHRHRDLIARRLTDEDIPFTVVGGVSLFEAPEIRDVEEGLRAIADPLNDAALVRMMTAGPWRLDAVEILQVTRDASFDRARIITAVRRIVGTGIVREDAAPVEAEQEGGRAAPQSRTIGVATRAKLRQLLDVLEELGPLTWREGPFTVLTRFLERTGVILDLLAVGTTESKRSVVNIGSLMRFASDWQADRPTRALGDFLGYLDAYKGAAGELPTSVELTEDVEGVRLMTLYQAKGLEFPIVVVPELLEGEWPVQDRGQGWFPVELLRGRPPAGDTHIEEERRLLYVAMTRAREHLVLTTYGAGQEKEASRFVSELREADGPHLRVQDRTRAGAGEAGAREADADTNDDTTGAVATVVTLAIGRRVLPIPTTQERRLALRLRAAELVSLIEAADPGAPETAAARADLERRLADIGRSAAVRADAARDQGLDPITLRTVALDSADGANLLQVAPLPPRFSYTSLSTYEDCPAKFAFGYVFRIPPPDRPAAPLAFGSTAHAAFEEFTRERRERIARGEPAPTREDLERIFRSHWQPVQYGDATTAASYERRAGSLLETFWQGELAGVGEALHEELDFVLVLEPPDGSAPVRIKGSIDRIDRLPGGGIEVIDYKTGKVSSQKDVNQNLQLSIYALACRDTLGLGTPEKVTLYFTESALRMSTTRTDEQLDAAREELLARAAQIRTGDFTATPGGACRYCDYRAICSERKAGGW